MRAAEGVLDGFERLAAGQCDEPFAGVVSKKALVKQVAGRLHLCPHLLTQLPAAGALYMSRITASL